MSDIRRVESDTRRAEDGMSTPVVIESRNMLVDLAKREHRGPADTWTAARDRAALRIGITPAQARRLWQRWEDMKDVSGGVYRALRNAYDDLCEMSEAAEARQDAEAERIAREIAEIHAATSLDGRRERIRPATAADAAAAASPIRRAG